MPNLLESFLIFSTWLGLRWLLRDAYHLEQTKRFFERKTNQHIR